jgi:hypothetical protein
MVLSTSSLSALFSKNKVEQRLNSVSDLLDGRKSYCVQCSSYLVVLVLLVLSGLLFVCFVQSIRQFLDDRADVKVIIFVLVLVLYLKGEVVEF